MRQTFRTIRLPLAASLAWATSAAAAEPTVQEQIDALKARLQELEAKVRSSAEAGVAPSAPKAAVAPAVDASAAPRVRGLVQFDTRWFFDKAIDNDAFLIRRARIGLEGKLGKSVDYQVTGEFAGSSSVLLDANFTFAYAPEAQLKLGRFKTPVGLEQLQPDYTNFFAERSVVSQFLPGRDVGLQVGGNLSADRVSYAIGVFNGTPDGANNTTQTDGNDGKSLVARVMFQPWVKDPASALAGLSFGVGGSYGLEDANGALASGYKTDGQQTLFAFRTAGAVGTTTAVTPNGRVHRLSPQFAYYRGSFCLVGEYAVSSAEVKAVNTTTANATVNSTKTLNLSHRAWQLQAGYVLTGEAAGFKGVVPASEFDRAAGTWGAFELVGRISSVHFDDQAFAGTANEQLVDPAKSARSADTLGVGLNWYPNKVARFSVDYEYTKFRQAPGAVAPAGLSVISHPEHVLLTRFGVNF